VFEDMTELARQTIAERQASAAKLSSDSCNHDLAQACSALLLQLHFTQFLEGPQRPGPKGRVNSPSSRELKPPAPSGILDLQP